MSNYKRKSSKRSRKRKSRKRSKRIKSRKRSKTKIRKSPTGSATEYRIGTKKRGNDGNMWVIVKTSDGIKRWKKIPLHKGAKSYVTHDNGGRPFKVYIDKKNVHIYKQIDSNNIHMGHTKLVKTYKNVQKVFVGKDSAYGFTGNSILIRLEQNHYVSIGWIIYEFKTTDEIIKYYSIVGNSDVPYPVALSKENVYMMLDKVYVHRSEFSDEVDWSDAYSEFYGHSGYEKPMKGKKMKWTKVIHKRIW